MKLLIILLTAITPYLMAQTTTAPPTNADINKKLDMIIERIEKLENNQQSTVNQQPENNQKTTENTNPKDDKKTVYKNGFITDVYELNAKDDWWNDNQKGLTDNLLASYINKKSQINSNDLKEKFSFISENMNTYTKSRGYYKVEENGLHTFAIKATTNGNKYNNEYCAGKIEINGNNLAKLNQNNEIFISNSIELEPGLYELEVLIACSGTYNAQIYDKTPRTTALQQIDSRIFHEE